MSRACDRGMEEPASPSPERRPGLYIVATPIGNLGDVTHRALAVLRSVDRIACEDTRHSARLLRHYDIHRPLLSLNEHNEARRIPEIIEGIRSGQQVALVSDAGLPTISDPGQRLVHAVVSVGLHLEVIPGPSAVVTALAGSGLPTTPFYFGGFLAHKKGARSAELAAALARDCTSVYFDSPYRIVDTLQLLAGLSADHLVVVARELTKHYEDFVRGPARNVLSHFVAKPPKGEITLIIAPASLPKWMSSPPDSSVER